MNRWRQTRAARLVAVALVPLVAATVLVWSTSNRQHKVDKIPVAVVNNDTIISKPQKMAAGRALAAALTEPSKPDQNLDWTLTDGKDAESGLADGDYYAVLTIPSDFSKSIVSSGTDKPVQGKLSLVSNSAASVTVPYISDKVATAAADSLGVQTTQGYLKNVYEGFNQIASSNKKAASNASSLASGTDQLSTGAGQLDDGAGSLAGSLTQIQDGAAQLQSGTASVRSGADQVSSGAAGVASGAAKLHGGAGSLAGSAGRLAGSSRKVAGGSSAVATGASGLARGSTDLARADRLLALELGVLTRLCDPLGHRPRYCAAVARAEGHAVTLAQRSGALAGKAGTLAGSARQVADGSRRLAQGDAELAGGARSLAGASGNLAQGAGKVSRGASSVAAGATTVDQAAGSLAAGTQKSAAAGASLASGASSLSSSAGSVDHGANQLSDGLSKGAKQSPTYSDSQQKALEDTVSEPVVLSHSLQNDGHGNGWLIAALVALVLWLAALVGAMRRDPAASLRDSSAPVSSRRLAFTPLLPVLGLAALEAVAVLVALVVLRVGAASVVPFAAFTVLAALVFTALAYAVRMLLGRRGVAGLVLLLMVQVAALGNVIPLETAPAPLRVLNGVLPLTVYVDGASQLLTGGSVGSRVADTLVLLVWGGLALLALVAAVRRRRVETSRSTPAVGLERMTGIEPA